MRWAEIVEDGPVGPRKPQKPKAAATGGIAPLSPSQSRTRAAKQQKAAAKLADVKASGAIKAQAAQRDLANL